MNTRLFETSADMLAAAAEAIATQASGKASFSIALSGGGTPQPLYSMLGSAPYRERLTDIPITWVVVDERFVPFSDPQSNAGMIQRTLFAEGLSPAHRFLPFRTDAGEPPAVALEFEREWKRLGMQSLDLVLLGIGDDGHTASLFPGTTALGVEDRIATEVYVGKLDAWRITLTKPVIRAAASRLVLVAGESKKPVVKAIREGGDFPIVQATHGTETWWFLDRSAWPDPA